MLNHCLNFALNYIYLKYIYIIWVCLLCQKLRNLVDLNHNCRSKSGILRVRCHATTVTHRPFLLTGEKNMFVLLMG